MADQFAALDQARSTLIDLSIRFGPKVFVALVILAAGFFVGRTFGRFIGRWLSRLDLEPPVRRLMGVVEKLREARIEIPFPQREIRMLNGTAA